MTVHFGDGTSLATGAVSAGGSSNISFDSGRGIDFSATSGTGTSELFDDYEEGTWTPSVTYTNGGSSNYSQRDGYYTKTGRFVHCLCNVRGGGNKGGSGNNPVRITGLPFTSGSSRGMRIGGTVNFKTNMGGMGSTPGVVVGDTNSTEIRIKDGAMSDITRNDLNFSDYHFALTFSYIVS